MYLTWLFFFFLAWILFCQDTACLYVMNVGTPVSESTDLTQTSASHSTLAVWNLSYCTWQSSVFNLSINFFHLQLPYELNQPWEVSSKQEHFCLWLIYCSTFCDNVAQHIWNNVCFSLLWLLWACFVISVITPQCNTTFIMTTAWFAKLISGKETDSLCFFWDRNISFNPPHNRTCSLKLTLSTICLCVICPCVVLKVESQTSKPNRQHGSHKAPRGSVPGCLLQDEKAHLRLIWWLDDALR